MLTKRHMLTLGLGGAVAAVAARFASSGTALAAGGNFEVTLSDDEWKAKLTPMQFAVLREAATERAFTSVLNDEKRPGTFHCAGCDQHLFSADKKFDSGTGWPSFWQEVEGNVAFSTDYKLIYPRTEEHCARCGGHLGHVFDDGPQPTGKRHCINGVAMVFKPADGSEPVAG